MKKLTLFFIILLATLALAERPYDNVAEATFNALKTGDYSLLEPHLDDAMKSAFKENDFKAFREDLISKYGNLQRYSFVKEGKVKGFILGYYAFEFEKANVTLRLVFREINGEYKLSGLWIDAVNAKKSGLPLGIAIFFPIAGGFLALLTFYLLGFKKIGGAEILLGFVLVAITLFVQPLIQNAPFLGTSIRSNSDIVARGTSFVIIVAIWLGFVAGFFQEGLKYIFCRNRYLRDALFIGVGFGLGEAILLPLIQVVQLMTVGGIPPQLTTSLLSLGERYLATLFHAGTTIVLAYSYKNGFGRKALLVLSIAHGIGDTFAAYYQLTQSRITLLITYVLFLLVSLLLLHYALPKVREEREEDRIVW
ncbi:potassium transporter KefA [Thermococcus argininiproducens]|uniref:Potassium transporter KefA n=1 Tax=Thermococcus argininiproducens TaxID=2866384 RepID=A0A9E7MB44_9EURY|nr:potassium transporter KefA [Thermococcus argininiproducens]USH00524.1 potassium transporter KefA [Thermococcus argininiproducens]